MLVNIYKLKLLANKLADMPEEHRDIWLSLMFSAKSKPIKYREQFSSGEILEALFLDNNELNQLDTRKSRFCFQKFSYSINMLLRLWVQKDKENAYAVCVLSTQIYWLVNVVKRSLEVYRIYD